MRLHVRPARPDPPNRSTYGIDPDTGAVDQPFDEHQHEHDQTRLRVIFWEEMARASPSWVEHARTAGMQADFGVAVDECDNEWLQSKVAAMPSKLAHRIRCSSKFSPLCLIYLFHLVRN